MSDFQELLKKSPKPSVKQAKKAEAGERAEGVRDALKAGKGDILKGAAAMHMRKPGLAKAESLVRKRRQSMAKKRGR